MGRDRRVLPHNIEAEASILGGILLRNEVLSHLDTIEVEDFYDNRHRVVFQAIRNLEAAARPIDVVTLENEIAKAGKLEAIGGVAFLGELTLRVPIVENVVAYAEIVVEKYLARRLMLVASEIVERGYSDDREIGEYLDSSEARLLAATARRDKADDAANMGALVRRRMTELDAIAGARSRGEQALTGAPTGIETL